MRSRATIPRFVAEVLEMRRLLVGDIITITSVADVLYENRNGVVTPVPVSGIVQGTLSDDVFFVESSSNTKTLRIQPRNGHDHIIIATTHDMDDLGSSPIIIDAGNDSVHDTVTIQDDADAGDDVYNIEYFAGYRVVSKDDVTPVRETVSLANVATLDIVLLTNTGRSTVKTLNLLADEHVKIDDSFGGGGSIVEAPGQMYNSSVFEVIGGSGDDDLLADDPSRFLATLPPATMSFVAGPGNDRLFIDEDTLNLSSVNVRGNGADILHNFGGFSLTYSGLESLRIEQSGMTDTTWTVESTLGNMPAMTLISGDGDDTFNVGSGQIANVAGAVNILGGTGKDSVVVYDGARPTAASYAITDSAITATGFAGITMSSVERVTLNAGDGADTIQLANGIDHLEVIRVNGFGGADLFTGTPSDSATMTLDGGGGNDTNSFSRGGADGGQIDGSGSTFTMTFDNRLDVTLINIENRPAQPATPPNVPQLDAVQDTGYSSTDGNTNLLTVQLHGTVPAGLTEVTLYREFSSTQTIVGTMNTPSGVVGVYSFDITGIPLGYYSGDYSVRYQPVTSLLSSDPSPQKFLVIDQDAPEILPGDIFPVNFDMLSESDTGIDSSDEVTSDATPSFELRNLPGATNASYVYCDEISNGEHFLGIASRTQEFTAPAFPDGEFVVRARLMDTAGNLSPQTRSLTIVIDTVAPPPMNSAPDLLTIEDTGTSNTDNITQKKRPKFASATHSSAGFVRLLIDGVAQFGYSHESSNSVTSDLTDGIHSISAFAADLAGNLASVPSPALQIRVDTVAPQVTQMPDFFYQAEFGLPHAVRYLFDEDVEPSLAPADFVVTHTGTGATYAATVSYSASQNRAVLRFGSTVTGGVVGALPDGNYTAGITSGAITDVAGNSLEATTVLSFYVLAGDANRDRSVNFDDLLIVAQNYGTTGKTFSQGNFNYDVGGAVNFDDLLIVAQRYGTNLLNTADINASFSMKGSRRSSIVATIM